MSHVVYIISDDERLSFKKFNINKADSEWFSINTDKQRKTITRIENALSKLSTDTTMITMTASLIPITIPLNDGPACHMYMEQIQM